ncbi:MAG: ArsR/SmtB family transcription factor [Acidimicrobiales bacterium]
MAQKVTIPAGTDNGLCCSSVTEAPLAESEAVDLARTLAALADPVRLRLLSLVAAQDEICSCDLEVPLARSQPTISHHTKILAEAGLIIGQKRGRWTWWRIDPDRLATIRKALGG